jgi:hypothetical protein
MLTFDIIGMRWRGEGREVGGHVTRMGEMRYTHKILGGKYERK